MVKDKKQGTKVTINNLLLLLEFLIMAAAIMCGVEIIGLSYYFNK